MSDEEKVVKNTEEVFENGFVADNSSESEATNVEVNVPNENAEKSRLMRKMEKVKQLSLLLVR